MTGTSPILRSPSNRVVTAPETGVVLVDESPTSIGTASVESGQFRQMSGDSLQLPGTAHHDNPLQSLSSGREPADADFRSLHRKKPGA